MFLLAIIVRKTATAVVMNETSRLDGQCQWIMPLNLPDLNVWQWCVPSCELDFFSKLAQMSRCLSWLPSDSYNILSNPSHPGKSPSSWPLSRDSDAYHFYCTTRMHSADCAVARCLSVSVTCRYSVKILVCPYQTAWEYSDDFKVTPLFDAEYLRNSTRYRHSFYGILTGTYTHPTQHCHFE